VRYLTAVLLFLLAGDAVAQERVRRVDPSRKSAGQRRLEATTTLVKGQCVDGVTGKPLAGCVVEVKVLGRSLVVYPEVLLEPPKVTTGADGSFAIRVAAHESLRVSFDASLPGRWPRTGYWQYLEPGTVEEVGKVPMYVGVNAVGKVVDEQGKPIAGLSIGLDDLRVFLGCELDKGDRRFLVERRLENATTSGRAAHSRGNKVRWNTTADDGAFTSSHVLPPGRCDVRLGTNQYILIQPKQVLIPSEGPMEPVTVIVREQPCLSGIVVDDKGQPVANVLLQPQPGNRRSGLLASARTANDGTFQIYRPAGGGEQASISVTDADLFERPKPTEYFAWGEKDIRIELQPALRVPIRVVEAGSNEPVTQYAVRVDSLPATSNKPTGRLRHIGNHDRGVLTVAGVPRGNARIWVVPTDPKLLFKAVDIDAKERMGPLKIELERLVPMLVQVLDPKGMPVKNARVAVIKPGKQLPGLGGRIRMIRYRVVNPREEQSHIYANERYPEFDTQVFATRTDAGGQCIVHGISGYEDMRLHVHVGGEEVCREGRVAFGAKANGVTLRLPSRARTALLLMIARTELELQQTLLPGTKAYKKRELKLKSLRKMLSDLDKRTRGGGR